MIESSQGNKNWNEFESKFFIKRASLFNINSKIFVFKRNIVVK